MQVNKHLIDNNSIKFSLIWLYILLTPLALKIHMLFQKGNFSTLVQIFGILFLLLGTVLVKNKTHFSFNVKNLIIFTLFALLIFKAGISSFVIGNSGFLKNFGYILLPILCISYAYANVNNLEASRFLKYLYFSLISYVLIIFLLNFFGLNNPVIPDSAKVENHSRLALLFGFFVKRETLPLANGFNQIGIVAGLTFILSFIYLVKCKYLSNHIKIIILVPAILCSIYILIVSDAKVSFFLSLLISLLFLLPTKITNSFLFLTLILLSPLLLFFLINFLSLLSNYFDLQNIHASFSSLSHRTEFWDETLMFLSDLKFNHFFGYGFFSHYNIGLSEIFNDYTYGNRKIKFLNVHNNMLQTIIDFGYIGYLFIYSLFIVALNKLRKINTFEIKVGYISLIYLYVHGITESVPNIYNREILFFFICVFTATFMLKKKNHEKI